MIWFDIRGLRGENSAAISRTYAMAWAMGSD